MCESLSEFEVGLGYMKNANHAFLNRFTSDQRKLKSKLASGIAIDWASFGMLLKIWLQLKANSLSRFAEFASKFAFASVPRLASGIGSERGKSFHS